MAGASIETTLELWASSLGDVKARMRPLFTQERVAASAGLFLDVPSARLRRLRAMLTRACRSRTAPVLFAGTRTSPSRQLPDLPCSPMRLPDDHTLDGIG